MATPGTRKYEIVVRIKIEVKKISLKNVEVFIIYMNGSHKQYLGTPYIKGDA